MLKQTGNSRGWVRVPSPEPEDRPAPPVVVSRIGPARPAAAKAGEARAKPPRVSLGRGGWNSRPVAVDGAEYPSMRAAADAAGCDAHSLGRALREGRNSIKGHEVSWAEKEGS